MGAAYKYTSERRAELLLNDLLLSQGWDLRRPPHGEMLLQNEYRSFPELKEALFSASKSGTGHGIPEAILFDHNNNAPLAVIEAKKTMGEADAANAEAQAYADALWNHGWHPLAVGLAGTTDDEFKLSVFKRIANGKWKPVTYEGYPIGWIPTRLDFERVAIPGGSADIRPSIPPLEVLAARADEMNRLLREARIRDEYRPAVVAATMLALWFSKGSIRRDAQWILKDINQACKEAFVKAGKPMLASSLRVDEANDKLRIKARRIATILERLNVTVLTAEHDYLGQLYETFFRYTGGNTIGQYFTPRHITRMMADVCEVTKNDIILDAACGTGGFLVACMDRILSEHHVSRAQMVEIVKTNLIGFEDEPVTAALCVANMILRGDGSTGVHKDDCFTSPDYPIGEASVALMNPPFPHVNTDTPVEPFVERALEGLKNRGKLAIILPFSLLVKKDKGAWREKILANNTLQAVVQLPNELFQPFASATTAFVVIEKGVPHNAKRNTTFIRLHYDGLTLRKGTRVERPTEPNQIPAAIDAILNRASKPGFANGASVSEGDEWAPGAYVESAMPEPGEVKANVDVLLRRLASFYTRYAKEVIEQRRAVEADDLTVKPYREMITKKRLTNAQKLPSEPDTIGGYFDIFYGMKELHSREGIAEGRSLVISPTEEYNGCYGWLEYPDLIEAPFVTVAQTGSIGEAFVQLENCAVNDDCLILLPKVDKSVSITELVLAAASLQAEKWRFTYGRKLTPSRIASFRMPITADLRRWVDAALIDVRSVICASLRPYQSEDERDVETAELRLAEVNNGLVVSGKKLEKMLAALEQE
ncbi:MAG: class I SAM-dependent DNA methyltransferase [Pyrinomonadaceae bacterium]